MICDLPPIDCLGLCEQKTEVVHYSEQHLESVKRTKGRRAKLLDLIKKNHPDKKGAALLFSGFKEGEDTFISDSSFFYLTDTDCLKTKNTQASVLMLDVTGGADQSTLYVPRYSRYDKYYNDSLEPGQVKAADLGLDNFLFAGDEPNIIRVYNFFEKEKYGNVISRLKEITDTGGTVFCLHPDNEDEYIGPRTFLERLSKFIPGLESSVVDISPLLTSMRRKKDSWEIEQLRRVVQFTMKAHRTVARAIGDGKRENELRGKLEKIYYSKELRLSFPPVVAAGKNSCTLHHMADKSVMKDGDLVVVDTGARYNHYCGDITITYPVSGKFTEEQQKVYNVVLEIHNYIANIAKPGFYLNNAKCPEKSLNHLYEQFSKERGYKKKHCIGHRLGLDVYDVDYDDIPLTEGDVITVEPGIYLSKKQIGIRIEDDYVMTKDGLVSLSGFSKTVEAVETMMQRPYAS